jgi:hypothetical protein
MDTRTTTKKKWLGVIFLTAAIIVLALSESFNPVLRHRRRNQCLNNLHIIHSTVISAALEGSYYRGDVIPLERITDSLKKNRIPYCPSGGHYTVPPVGGRPVCSYHGDIFGQEGLVIEALSLKGAAIPERFGK